MHDTEKAGLFGGIKRSVFSWFDWVIFSLLTYVYQVFFLVANNTIINTTTVKVFFSRVQLIVGVVILFRLAFSLISGIVNPESLTDKEKGFSKIITRIIIALTLLVATIPLNIPNAAEGSWEEKLNDNGILFGTLYGFQEAVLENNTVAKLILGAPATETKEDTSNTLQKSAADLSINILKSFISPNKSEQDGDEDWCKEDSNYKKNMVAYNNATNPGDVLARKDDYCIPGKTTAAYIDVVSDKKYQFAYMGLVSAVTGGIVCFLFIGYTLDIAIRSLKLVVLRLIAPVAALSYIDPKSSKDGGMFASWTKSLVSTYLELFMRLAIIYFSVFISQQLTEHKPAFYSGGGVAGIFAFVFMLLGVLFFAKQAPKFISNALGLKGLGGSVGLSGMLGGTAALLGGGGLSGAGAAMMNASQQTNEAISQGKQAPGAWSSGRDLAAQIRTGDPKAKGGILNSINDRLMRNAGVKMARKYGVTAAGLDKAKTNMLDLQAKSSAADSYHERLLSGDLSARERSELVTSGNAHKDSRTGKFMVHQKAVDAAAAESAELARQAGKAKTSYDEAKKFGDSHRVTTSFEEEHRRSFREMLPGHESSDKRPDMYTAKRKGITAHQGIIDRVTGSRDDWKDPKSKRTDNRWIPGSSKGADSGNEINDNPNTTIGSVGRGSGNGDRGA